MPQNQTTGYRMPRNHSNAIPRYVISYSVETKLADESASKNQQRSVFLTGHARSARYRDGRFSGEKQHCILSPADFWGLVKRTTAPNYTVWIVCHGALRDMIVTEMPAMFESDELTIEWPRTVKTKENNRDDNVHANTLCVIDDPPTIIAAKCKSSGGRLVIVDLQNWFRVSLDSLAEKCGVDLKAWRKLESAAIPSEGICAGRSLAILNSFMELMQWTKTNDMGMFRYTGPSQAMAAYRHRFMDNEIFIHDNKQVKQIERLSYYGGRTEIFKIGQTRGLVHQYDVNSLFPSVMFSGSFPQKLDRYEISDILRYPRDDIEWSRSAATVEVSTDDPTYPVRVGSLTLYPVGTFVTALAGEELSNAWKLGHIRRVGSWAEYTLAPLFKEWVTELWRMRQEYKSAGNAMYEEFAKLLMNSLYGKFGQRSPAWTNVQGGIADIPWSTWTEINCATRQRKVYRSFGWQVQEYTERGEIEGTFVAISAFITAAARCRMNRLRATAGKDNVLYQGVDSLLVTDTGANNLTSAGEVAVATLGKMRHQITAQECEVRSHNDYTIGDKVVVSGLAVDNYTDAVGTIRQRLVRVASCLFTGITPASFEVNTTEWQRHNNYTKGCVGGDGWIQPLRMTAPGISVMGGASDSC